jgi:solute carrier family 12 sodium/potassium/chloride transporter 2
LNLYYRFSIYIAQAIAVAMYVFGFREGLQLMLPEYNPLFLDIEDMIKIVNASRISGVFCNDSSFENAIV